MGKYGVISADTHMDIGWLPPDLFVSRVPAQWKDQAPRVVETREGAHWVAGKQGEWKCGSWAGGGIPYYMLGDTTPDPREIAKLEAGFKREQRRPAVPAYRLQDQDLDGIDAEVIFGPFAVVVPIPDFDLVAACFAAYNEFIAEFNQTHPDRFYGLGMVVGNNPQAAVREVEHAAKLGLPGVMLTLGGLAKPLWHQTWEPLWAALAKHRLPVTLHIGGGTTTVGREGLPGEGPSLPSMAAFVSVCTLQADEPVASFIFSGALERNPNLKVTLAECDVGWIPYLLERMDYLFEDNYFKWKELITTKPSDLFRRQLHATFERDSIGPRLAAEFCPDSFLWGNDYPHTNDATWPNSHKAIQQYLGAIDPKLRRKLIHDNVAALYHIV